MKKQELPELTAIIEIDGRHFPIILLPTEDDPLKYEHLYREQDGKMVKVNFTRRYPAVQYLWKRARESSRG